MGFENEKDADTRRRSAQTSAVDPSPRPKPGKKKGTDAPDVGHALRSAYERTVNEQIPPDLLDLLGKLG